MKYQSYDLGKLKGGEIIEMTLKEKSANVKLMDISNFSNFKSGLQHTYYGGHATCSPYRVSVPKPGHWYVIIDLGGNAGQVSSSIRVFSGQIKPEAQPILSTDEHIGGLKRNNSHSLI
jgi:hypothetical protein